jgi:hypothetical protein
LTSPSAQAAQVSDHQWTLEEVIEMMDTYFLRKMEAEFEAAFAAKYTPLRTMPKTYAQKQPKVPWYLDPNSGGEPESELP